jgi:hypothetical protein
METEETVPNYHRALLMIAELIKAIVEEMIEEQDEPLPSHLAAELSATGL